MRRHRDLGDRPWSAHGISSGGGLVIEALAAGVGVDKASLLETPYRVEGAPPVPDNYVATLERVEAARRATVPTMARTGTQMPFLRQAPAAIAAALPNGHHVELEGGFHEVSPEVLTPALAEFTAVDTQA